MKIRNIILIGILLLGLTVMAGCGSDKNAADNTKSSGTTTETAKQEEAKPVEYKLYFPDANGEKLVGSMHQFKDADGDKYLEVVNALVAGPTDPKDGIEVMPQGTKVLDVNVKDGVATVNFNNAFVKHFPGGSTSELMIIGSIVNTLTEFPEVKSVQFQVEGKAIDSLSGHLDLSMPQKRMKDLL